MDALLTTDQSTEAGIRTQREKVAMLKVKLEAIKDDTAALLVQHCGCAGEEIRLDHWR